MISELITLIILICLSGFFSGVEIALFSLSRLRVQLLVRKKLRGAETVAKLKRNPQRLLITILIGNNVVNVGASVLATSVIFEIFKSHAVAITTGIMTLLLLVFGEIIPKSFATRYNQRISLSVAKPMQILQAILFPLIIIFETMTNILLKKMKPRGPIVTPEEIKAFVSIGEEAGQIKQSEKELIHHIFRFGDLDAKAIMTARRRIRGISSRMKIKNAVKIFGKYGYSRLPVFKNNLDHIIGFVYIRDIIKLSVSKRNKNITSIMRPMSFVPNVKKIDTLLTFLQRKKQHVAIVVNEFGTNIGLITMEDILEEIVGEIVDETEKLEPMIKRIARNSYLVQGKTDIDEINEKCKLNLPEEKGAHPISSYLLEHIGRIPEEEEVITFPQCEIKIKSIEHNAISTVIIKKKMSTSK